MRAPIIAAVILTVLVMTASLSHSAHAAKKVTIEADKAPVVDVIESIFKDTGLSYTIEPGVSSAVTASLNNVSFEDALKAVTEIAGLKYELRDGRYIISKREPDAKQTKESEQASKTDTASSAEESAKPEESAAQENEQAVNQMSEDYSGPVAYGSLPPYGAYYEVGAIRNLILPPYEPYTITDGGGLSGAVSPLPPPGLRSVTLQRMLAQMNALYSVPGYGAPTIKPLSRPNIFLTTPYYGF